jgi:hypothetical protein
MKRSLVLRRERLAALTAADLSAVAGAAEQRPTWDCPDNTYYCLLTGQLLCGMESDTTICPWPL